MGRVVLSAVGLVVAVAGFVTFATLGVASWPAKRAADRQVIIWSGKANTAADAATKAIALIREIIARARQKLVLARVEHAAVVPEPANPLVRFALSQAKRDLPGEVDRAQDAVGIASEAVVVAGAALDVFDDLPGDGPRYGFKPDEVQAAREQLDAASRELKSARSIFGVPIHGTTAEQLRNVDAALDRAQKITDQFDSVLSEARSKVDAAGRKAEAWSLRAALAITLLAALAAVGQAFMARACWHGLRGRSAPRDPVGGS